MIPRSDSRPEEDSTPVLEVGSVDALHRLIRSGRVKNRIGDRYGRLVVVSFAGVRDESRWNCLCDCGVRFEARTQLLRNGRVKSCGCLKREINSRLRGVARHGMSKSPEWGVWKGMRRRCSNPKDPRFVDYGGRGIRVCDRWQSFDNFIADMGRRPAAGFDIDRTNNNGDYEPSNCRWVPRAVNLRNTRRNRRLTFRGETMTAAEWAKRLGLHTATLYSRLDYGWSTERALTEVPSKAPRGRTASA